MPTDWKDALASLRGEAPKEPEEKTAEKVAANQGANTPLQKEPLHIAVERKGRGGKTATIIYGFQDNVTEDEIEGLGRQLRRSAGTGGSARGGEILLQGDCRERAATLLRQLGYKVK